jgi:hypothetical protein
VKKGRSQTWNDPNERRALTRTPLSPFDGMTAETRTNSDLHETWTIEDLTAFGAKLSRRRSRDEPVPGPPDQFGEIRIFQNRHQIGRYHSG